MVYLKERLKKIISIHNCRPEMTVVWQSLIGFFLFLAIEAGFSQPSTRVSMGMTTTTTPYRSICGPEQLSGQSGGIRSPYFPYNFQGASCNYQINGSSNAVNIQIPAIHTNNFWYIDIYEGTADSQRTIYSISSRDAPRAIAYSSPTPYMLIQFYSDDSNSGTPFIMNFNSTYFPAFSTGYLGPSTPLPYSPPPYTSRPSTLPPSGRCPDGWVYNQMRNFCYTFIPSPRVLDSAENLCHKYGGQLFSVHSEAEEENLFALLDEIYSPTTNYQVWLGGSWLGGNQWIWNDGTPFMYSDWLNDISNGEYCMAAVSEGSWRGERGWKPVDCSKNLPSLCYKPSV